MMWYWVCLDPSIGSTRIGSRAPGLKIVIVGPIHSTCFQTPSIWMFSQGSMTPSPFWSSWSVWSPSVQYASGGLIVCHVDPSGGQLGSYPRPGTLS